MMQEDTIVAAATPPGRGGLGVVRLSGSEALEITLRLIRFSKLPLETQRATLGEFCDPQGGRVLDQVVVTCFRRPHSYTAEDVVEISCHGAPVILRYLVECCLSGGARAAEPGEFTMRAFLNGRIDLTQAEAVRDLIESRTLYQARVAAQQLEGAVSARLKPYKQVLLELIARLEAGIDFAEDDVSIMDGQEIIARIDSLRVDIEQRVRGYEYGRIVREGISLAIIGRPNVGKSSLFNRLLDEERAIVTSTPGTTRDLVAETSSIEGIPLRFVDTAGIRHTEDEVERMGVEKSFQAIADSDLRLLVVDASEGWTDDDSNLLRKVRPLGALLIACNKSDLPPKVSRPDLDRLLTDHWDAAPDAARGGKLSTNPVIPSGDSMSLRLTTEHEKAWIPASAGMTTGGPPRESGGPLVAASAISMAARNLTASAQIVWTSALTGQGIPELKERILEIAAPARDLAPDGEFITGLRHQQLLKDSLQALTKARQAAEQKLPHEMLLLDLYDALRPLDQITGATYVDDVLDFIFSTFCVGK
jgi:tRNA modification GTPase